MTSVGGGTPNNSLMGTLPHLSGKGLLPKAFSYAIGILGSCPLGWGHGGKISVSFNYRGNLVLIHPGSLIAGNQCQGNP